MPFFSTKLDQVIFTKSSVPDILKLWGEAFGMGMVEGWVEENEDRLGEKEVVLIVMMVSRIVDAIVNS